MTPRTAGRHRQRPAAIAIIALLLAGVQPIEAACPAGGYSIDTDTVAQLVPHPAEPNTVFAIQYPLARDSLALLKSCDAGDTWSATALTSDFYSVSSIAISPVDDSLVYASTNLGGLVSHDGGIRWAETELPGVDLRFTADGSLFAWNVGRVYRLDAGRTEWETLTPVPEIFRELRVHPNDPARLHVGQYYSVDAGASWQRVRPDFVYDLAWSRSDPGFLIATAKPVPAVVSHDGGVNWQDLPLAEFEFFAGGTFDGRHVAIDPRDSRVIWIATLRCGVFASRDGGAHWRPMNDALTGEAPNCQFGADYPKVADFALSPADPDRMYAVTSDGVFTRYAAAAWTQANGRETANREPPPPHPYTGSADLAFSLSSLPGSYTPPVTFRFSGTIRNLGPDTARGARLSINATVVSSTRGDCGNGSCEFGDVAAGAVINLEFERSLLNGGHGANCTGDVFMLGGNVSALTDDPDPDNNLADISSIRQNNASLISRCEGEGLLTSEGGGSFGAAALIVLLVAASRRSRRDRSSSGSRCRSSRPRDR